MAYPPLKKLALLSQIGADWASYNHPKESSPRYKCPFFFHILDYASPLRFSALATSGASYAIVRVHFAAVGDLGI